MGLLKQPFESLAFYASFLRKTLFPLICLCLLQYLCFQQYPLLLQSVLFITGSLCGLYIRRCCQILQLLADECFLCRQLLPANMLTTQFLQVALMLLLFCYLLSQYVQISFGWVYSREQISIPSRDEGNNKLLIRALYIVIRCPE